MTKEEAALKAIAQASRKMVNDFFASDDGQQLMGDVFAGLGVYRVTDDGTMQRVEPSDFRFPPKADAR